MWGHPQRLSNLSLELIEDLHAQNYLVSFDSSSMNMSELLAKDVTARLYGDPAESYVTYDTEKEGEKVRIYDSVPINTIADGELFPLNRIKVKLADFGKGLLHFAVELTVASFEDEPDELRQRNGFGDKRIIAPEALLGFPWSCKADIWS